MIKLKQKPNTPSQLKKILNPIVDEWFFSRFSSFSQPQLFGVLDIHSRKNILISAPTGSTKTLTGFLSILNELIDSDQKGLLKDKVYCVYISPLKALNNDIEKNLKEPLAEMEKIAGKKLNIRIAVRTGDTTQSQRSRMLKNPPHILITTPESIAILLSSPKFRENLKNVQWCIIDEIHAIADNKRGVHLSLSLERLSHLSDHMARIGLSATVAPLEKVARFLAGDRDCEIVDIQYLKKMDLQVLSPVPDLTNISHKELHHKMYALMDNLISKHKTTLIFTNTRAATERIVDHLKAKFPKRYSENPEKSEISGTSSKAQGIGAHHGSLSKEHRTNLEKRLRQGKLKAVVCSTSLELGIDIGFIDLVICLGSPKSVARALQRIGRSGHRLHETTKGRFIVMNMDDLVECSVILKSGIEKKIDQIHIPQNCLDVLAQQIFGMAIDQKWDVDELYSLIRKSYCYRTLNHDDYLAVLDYLSGRFTSLEDRHVYAKIWHDKEENMIGKKGRLARVIYMTNIGTIPDETSVIVKLGNQPIGTIEESFLERLKPGDIFVLGGNVYKFRNASGMVARVTASAGRPPTVPRWFSDSLPLSFDLAMDISKFRRLMEDKFNHNKTGKEIISFINKYLYVDDNAANAIYEYFRLQYNYAEIPTDKEIIIEHIDDGRSKKVMFHTLYGRRVNDVLSRAVAYIIGKTEHKDVEIGINDNGFYISYLKKVNVMKAFSMLRSDKIDLLSRIAIDKSEILKRRFRHCAGRALMILRNYKGKRKRVGRQQVSSMILISAVRRISDDFPILKEARREVLEDLMDLKNAKKIVRNIEDGKIKLKEISHPIPSPFAFNLIIQGFADILKIEDRMEFLRRMQQQVKLKIALKNKEPIEEKDIPDLSHEPLSYSALWGEDAEEKEAYKSKKYQNRMYAKEKEENKEKPEEPKLPYKEQLYDDLKKAANRIGLDSMLRHECERLIKGDTSGFRKPFIEWLENLVDGDVPDIWSSKLVSMFRNKIKIIK
ncbi:MAG: ATP-dependent helicase [Nanoarchaeota archaeon]|nr:ATP-dependent helicase [Nanoarchaeota archaeon]